MVFLFKDPRDIKESVFVKLFDSEKILVISAIDRLKESLNNEVWEKRLDWPNNKVWEKWLESLNNEVWEKWLESQNDRIRENGFVK